MKDMENTLLLTLLLPIAAIPAVFFIGKKSPKAAPVLLASVAIADIFLILTIAPAVLGNSDHKYIESYEWIASLNSSFAFFVDGISLPLIIITLTLILAATMFSLKYIWEKKRVAEYYTLLTMLSIGLLGVFITSNLMLFYFFWELMLVPAFFIISGWGYKDSSKAAFKFFIFTHIGAVFVLLSIGAIYVATGSLDMFQVQAVIKTAQVDIVKWVLIGLTAGFAVKMAIVPVHMWLPDAHAEAPAPMSALLSGIIISAGAYAILRISLQTVFPAVLGTQFGANFLHGLAIFGIISAFYGSFIALVETDIKRIIAFSSIAHMGYILFGLSFFPFRMVMIGTVLHITTHALSKGLLFLSAGAIMHQSETRDIREMGGFAGEMPIIATCSTTAALSIAGTPPFACFISEFLIFVGAVQAISMDSFYILPILLMLIATVFSLAYALRFVGRVFLGTRKTVELKKDAISRFMKIAMVFLAILIVVLGIFPAFFIDLISTVTFG